jgi:integrase
MARIQRNTDLGTREQRRALRPRAEPYFMQIEKNLLLGYRKSSDGGAWIVKRNIVMPADAEHPKPWRSRPEQRLAMADDYRDADGKEVLTFAQAQRKILVDAHTGALRASGHLDTVSDVVQKYVEFQRTHRKGAVDTSSKLKSYVLESSLAHKQVSKLVEADIDAWFTWALKRPRKRAVKDDDAIDTAERQRRRKATINRIINPFKACLRRAGAPEHALKRLQKFRGVKGARVRWLTEDEARRLQNASAPDLRKLVRAALQSGCRLGELLALRARDFEPQSKTILIADSKRGNSRRVYLTDAGVALFEELMTGKAENDKLFKQADGSDWYRVAIGRAMREACTGGKITPRASFHVLRHTFASHLVQAGVSLLIVATALGHSDTRMVEQHYGHLAPSHIADAIRQHLPSFGAIVSKAKSKVRKLRPV